MRLFNILASVLFATVIITFVSGCYYDKEELLYRNKGAFNCATVNAKFAVDVQPIIQSKCASSGCHDAATSAGGVSLETYTQIFSAADRINQRSVVDKTMPTSGPLSTAEIAILKCWIDAGAPNN